MGINGFSDVKSDVSSADWNNNNSCDKVFSYGNERRELDYKTYESLKGEKANDGTNRVTREERAYVNSRTGSLICFDEKGLDGKVEVVNDKKEKELLKDYKNNKGNSLLKVVADNNLLNGVMNEYGRDTNINIGSSLLEKCLGLDVDVPKPTLPELIYEDGHIMYENKEESFIDRVKDTMSEINKIIMPIDLRVNVSSDLNIPLGEYDLNDKTSRDEFSSYFNLNIGGDENMKNLIYVNGIMNSRADAEETANLLKEITGEEFRIFNNETKGMDNDLANCVNGYNGADLLLANTLLNMSKDGNYKDNLVVSHSRGNINLYKALDILDMNEVNLNNNVNMINVAIPGSTGDKNILDSLSFIQPKAKDKLEDKATNVGVNTIGQYNNRLDVITWDPKAQMVIASGAAVGAAVGIETGEALIGALVGAAGGAATVGVAGALDIRMYHTINSYLSEKSKVLDSKSTGSTGNNLYKDLKNLDNLINSTRAKNLQKIAKK